MLKWIHHLLNPHCADCRAENECDNCNVLRQLLEREKQEKKELLDKLFPTSVPQVEEKVERKPLRTNAIPWRVKQQMLEQEDAAKARIMEQLRKDEELINHELHNTPNKLVDNK